MTDCPYKRMCKKYPDCPSNCRSCDKFQEFIQKEAARHIKPVKWKLGKVRV